MKKLKGLLLLVVLLWSVAPVAFAAPIYGILLQANVADQSGNIFNIVDEAVPAGAASSKGTIGLVDLTASASANLFTGEVKAKASCLPLAQNCVASAMWEDTLLFDLTNVPAGETLNIRAKVDGTYSRPAQVNFQLVVQYVFASLNTTVGYRTSQEYDSVASPEIFLEFGRSGNFTTFGPDLFVGTLDLLGGAMREVYVSMRIRGDSEFDLGNTAVFSLESSVPYTSASGVFLSEQPNGSVPEPATLFLFGIGIAGLGFARRKKSS